MSNDNSNSEGDAPLRSGLAERIAAEWPKNRSAGEVTLRERIDHLRAQRTLTSMAYTSAEAFSPDQAGAVKAFQEALSRVDRATVFLLDSGAMKPREVGIETNLKLDAQKVLISARKGDIELTEAHDRELQLARISARGPMWAELAKVMLWVLVGISMTLLGSKVF